MRAEVIPLNARPTAPPHNLEAEQAVLGALLFDNGVVATVTTTLVEDEFHEPFHAFLYRTICERVAEGRLADPTTLMDRLKISPAFEQFGGIRYLADLIDWAPPVSHVLEYARTVKDAAGRRSLLGLADNLKGLATKPEEDPLSLAAWITEFASAMIADGAPDTASLVGAREAAVQTVRDLDHEAETGVSSGILVGLDCIDRALSGLFPNELIVLAGRPSMGKSGLARAIAMAGARHNPELLFPVFALEMDRRQLSRRTLSQLTFEAGRGLPYKAMKTGVNMPGEDRALLAEMAQRVPLNLLLDDTAVLSLDHVRRRLMALSRRGRIGLAVIDYLQIMDLTAQLQGGMNLTTAIGMVTSGLKQLAKQLQCPILLLSQLSRKCEERDNKRPMLSDLRDSGAIEQDASTVMFAYRDVYYLEREGPRRGTSREEHEMAVASAWRTMEVILAKCREGAIGTTRQRYLAEFDVVENEGWYR